MADRETQEGGVPRNGKGGGVSKNNEMCRWRGGGSGNEGGEDKIKKHEKKIIMKK